MGNYLVSQAGSLVTGNPAQTTMDIHSPIYTATENILSGTFRMVFFNPFLNPEGSNGLVCRFYPFTCDASGNFIDDLSEEPFIAELNGWEPSSSISEKEVSYSRTFGSKLLAGTHWRVSFEQWYTTDRHIYLKSFKLEA